MVSSISVIYEAVTRVYTFISPLSLHLVTSCPLITPQSPQSRCPSFHFWVGIAVSVEQLWALRMGLCSGSLHMYVFHRRLDVTFMVLPFCHLPPNSIITKFACLLWCPLDQWLSSRLPILCAKAMVLCFLSMRMITVLTTFNPLTWAVHKMDFLLPSPSFLFWPSCLKKCSLPKWSYTSLFPCSPSPPLLPMVSCYLKSVGAFSWENSLSLPVITSYPQEWRKCA